MLAVYLDFRTGPRQNSASVPHEERMQTLLSRHALLTFAQTYLQSDLLIEDLNTFIDKANKGTLRYRFSFWTSQAEENQGLLADVPYAQNFHESNKKISIYGSFKDAHDPSVRYRKNGVSPFSKEEAMAIAQIMKEQRDIVDTTIVLQNTVCRFFNEAAKNLSDPSVPFDHSLNRLNDVASVNSFFGEFMPHILAFRMENPGTPLEDCFHFGMLKAIDKWAFSSVMERGVQRDQKHGAEITICPFSKFIGDFLGMGHSENMGRYPAVVAARLGDLRGSGHEIRALQIP